MWYKLQISILLYGPSVLIAVENEGVAPHNNLVVRQNICLFGDAPRLSY